MRFVTLATACGDSSTHRRQSQGRGEYFHFEYQLRRDPSAEGVRVRLGEALTDAVWPDLLPAIPESVRDGVAAAVGVRFCCIDL